MSDRVPGHKRLPAELAEIAGVAGVEAALKLARARGGTEVYIPAKLTPGHWLIECVGEPAAKAICAHFVSGVSVILPMGPVGLLAQVRQLADRMIEEGKSTSEIVRATGYISRTVERRRARLKKRRGVRRRDQMELFS